MKAYLIMAEYSYFFHIDFLLIKSDYAKLIAEGKFAEADELERLLIEAELLMVVFSILWVFILFWLLKKNIFLFSFFI